MRLLGDGGHFFSGQGALNEVYLSYLSEGQRGPEEKWPCREGTWHTGMISSTIYIVARLIELLDCMFDRFPGRSSTGCCECEVY